MRIILDLDQTVISAEPTEEFNVQKEKKKSSLFVSFNMDNYYKVFERPHLQEFLDWIFENFIVSVWTAASKDYALFVIDKIILQKPGRKLDFILFSYHCDISLNKKNSSKDLTTLWDVFDLPGYSRENTVILDDYDDVYKSQPGHCIVAVPFEYTKKDSHKDNFLIGLKRKLEKMKHHYKEGGKNPAETVNNK